MSDDTVYQINAPSVISEVIDGEAIILNFDSGSYYSLNESGMAIWQGILQGRSCAQIERDLQQRYDAPPETVAADLAELVQRFLSEQLIVAAQSAAAAGVAACTGPVAPYLKPGMEQFTDLQELLLLDPIHDVDASGWPHQAP